MCAPSEGPIALEDFAKTFAEAICGQKEACGCEVDFSCAGVLAQSFQVAVDFAAEHALAYDATCAGEFLAFAVTGRGCAVRSEFYDDYDCWNRCQIFQGEAPTGGACDSEMQLELYPFVEACAVADDSCVYPDDVCGVPESVTLMEGETCFSQMEGPLGSCEDGTICNYNTLVCETAVGEGESCEDGVVCDYQWWCNAELVCQARLEAGKPCTTASQCRSYRCDGGTCSDPVNVCEIDEIHDMWFLPFP